MIQQRCWQNCSSVMLLIIIYGFKFTGKNSLLLILLIFRVPENKPVVIQPISLHGKPWVLQAISFKHQFLNLQKYVSVHQSKELNLRKITSPALKIFWFFFFFLRSWTMLKIKVLWAILLSASLQRYQSGKDWENCVQHCVSICLTPVMTGTITHPTAIHLAQEQGIHASVTKCTSEQQRHWEGWSEWFVLGFTLAPISSSCWAHIKWCKKIKLFHTDFKGGEFSQLPGHF